MYSYESVFINFNLERHVDRRYQCSRPGPQPSPTPTPVVTDKQNVLPEDLKGVPAIAPNYRSDDRTLPDLGRVGVDIAQQRSFTLRDTIELALENNSDIEITRKSSQSARFDITAARGFFQPRLTAQSYYEHSTTPNVSVFSTNQKLTTELSSGMSRFKHLRRITVLFYRFVQ